MINLLIVDDHAVIRAGIRYFIDPLSDINVTAEASDGATALDILQNQMIDVVLLDIEMPGQSGIEVLKQIKVIKANVPVLVLSMHEESRYAVQVLRAGAAGFIQKEALAKDLVSAIRTVVHGKKYISFAVAELLTTQAMAHEDVPLHTLLSTREFEIFLGLCLGQSVTNLSSQLALSVKTVSTHRARVLDKMGMTSNADLIYYALKNNLID